MDTILLNNGIRMPLLGYGVFKVDPKECERCVADALRTGYRMIDTAQFYANEEGVGKAVMESGINREDLFIVTKVWISNSGDAKAFSSIEESLKKLRTDYVDLLLVHQPYGDYYGTYRALEKALESGKTRAIGLSNFYNDRFCDLTQHCNIIPAINQLETNIFSQQTGMRSLMSAAGTSLMAWGPMAQGKDAFFSNDILLKIGEKHGKTPSQIGLRFLVQQGIPAIPKTTDPARMAENIDIFDFILDDEDMHTLTRMNIHDQRTESYTDPAYAHRIISQKI